MVVLHTHTHGSSSSLYLFNAIEFRVKITLFSDGQTKATAIVHFHYSHFQSDSLSSIEVGGSGVDDGSW